MFDVMGIEYKLVFDYTEEGEVGHILARVPGSQLLDGQPLRTEFRSLEATEGMPDADASIQAYGLYFCDHGGEGRKFLGMVVAAIVSRFGPVQVAELE
jgi:hypothetical protein